MFRKFKSFPAVILVAALILPQTAFAQVDSTARGLAVKAQNAISGLTVKGDGVQSPFSDVVYAGGSSGVLTGAYGYNVTYVTATGETPPWSGTPVQVTLTGQQMSLINIPIGPPGTLKRRLYRTKANSGETKNTFFLVEIPNNTATTYTDNAPDTALGAPVSWIGSNYAIGSTVDGVALSFGNSGSVVVGALAKAGYASMSIGGQAGGSCQNCFRDVAMGAYALGGLTSGYENVGLGTHAGQGLKGDAVGNTVIGTYAMITGGPSGTQNYNTVIGHSAMNGFRGVGFGSASVVVGYKAAQYANTADGIVALGAYAGGWADTSRTVFIDNIDRGSIGGDRDIGLVFGQTAVGQTLVTAAQQELRLNARVRLGWEPSVALVANLPVCNTTALKGFRAYVTDASVVYSGANIGTTVVGAGTNTTPVFCTGTAWVIG